MLNSPPPVEHAPDFAALKKLGVYTFLGFQEHRQHRRDDDYLIQDFLRIRARNLLVGDSGLGKTAFTASMGIHLAAGVPWLGRDIPARARVLYCDGESGEGLFHDMIGRLAKHAGLPGVPSNFLFWNPTWSTSPPSANSTDQQLAAIVELARPDLVFVDPLRAFWPNGDRDDTARVIEQTTRLTKITGCAWVMTHHLRKRGSDGRASLEDDTLAYFQESCGSLALVNHTDARVGMEAKSKGEADLVVAGFLRGVGKVGPLHIVRDYDDDGDPLGYRLLRGVEHLAEPYRVAFANLPDDFRFRAAKDALGGKSSSNARAMLQQCSALSLIRKLDSGWYQKCGTGEVARN